jgi:hypothetical protein
MAKFLGLDRFGGAVQLGLGAAGLFVSGLAAGVGFLVAGVVIAGAGKSWDDSPAGQDGAVARAARAVAATSLRVPVVVIIDDADLLDHRLALTLVENLVDRWGSQVWTGSSAHTPPPPSPSGATRRDGLASAVMRQAPCAYSASCCRTWSGSSARTDPRRPVPNRELDRDSGRAGRSGRLEREPDRRGPRHR